MIPRTLKVNAKLAPFLTKPQPIKVAIGGRGCVAADTLIDTPSGQVRIDQFKGGEIYSYDGSGLTVAYAERPIRYPLERLYKVRFSCGRSIECTDQHRFLTPHGWRDPFDAHASRLRIYAYDHRQTSLEPYLSGSLSGVQHYLRILAGFLYCYFWYCHRYDRQLRSFPGTYQDVVQRLADEQQHKSRALSHLDDREFWSTHSLSQVLSHLSSLVFLLEGAEQSCEAGGNGNSGTVFEQISQLSQVVQQFREKSNHHEQVQILASLFQDFCTSEKYQGKSQQIARDIFSSDVGDSSYSDYLGCNVSPHYSYITEIVETTPDNYWDMFVPLFNNYLSNGLINHNSGKSIGFGDMLTAEMEHHGYDIYCLREFQDSITDSVHKVFKTSIEDRLDLPGWDCQANTIIAPNGARTTYKGANRNPDAMQSAHGYRRSWFEEAHRASQDSLDKLLPTILRTPDAQCWFSANPQSSADPFSQRFIVPYLKEIEQDGYYEDDLHYIVKINWRDNPWWNKEQERLRAWDFDNLPRSKYDWIWEGAFYDSVDDAIIDAEWFDAAIDAHKKLGFEPKGQIIVSHDPSDKGPDAKGLAHRHGVVVLDVQEKTNLDVNEGCEWAVGYALEHNADVYIWDCDGIGAGLRKQTLDELAGKKVDHVEFRGSKGVDNPKATYQPTDTHPNAKAKSNEQAFKNRRAQYYWKLRDRFYKTYQAVVKGKYVDPDEMISLSSGIKNMTALRSEVCRIPRKPNGAGLIQIMSKEEMARQTPPIASPNMADALMMCEAKPDIKVATELHFRTAYG